MTPAFKSYLLALVQVTMRSDVDDSDLRDEMRDWWALMTEEEQAVANDVAKAFEDSPE